MVHIFSRTLFLTETMPLLFIVICMAFPAPVSPTPWTVCESTYLWVRISGMVVVGGHNNNSLFYAPPPKFACVIRSYMTHYLAHSTQLPIVAVLMEFYTVTVPLCCSLSKTNPPLYSVLTGMDKKGGRQHVLNSRKDRENWTHISTDNLQKGLRQVIKTVCA